MSTKLLKATSIVILSFATYCGLLLGQELTDDLEKEAKAIEGLLIAPCCWRQPVSVHYSPAADEIRTEIRRMLRSGLTRQEILDTYVVEYGDQILAKPPAEGFNLLAYLLPLAFLVLGGFVAVYVFKRLSPRKTVKKEIRRPAKLESDDEERLERELWG
jgi:cytochrome c-type biogenesis protein CcmH